MSARLTSLTAVARRYLAPLVLTVLVGLAFIRALTGQDLAWAIGLGGGAGWLAAIACRRLAEFIPRPALSRVTTTLLVLAAYVGTVAFTAGGFGFEAVADAVTTFLVIGLPARGLDHLATAAVLVLFPVGFVTTAASLGRHTLTTLVVPVVGLVAAALLVAPVGLPWWVPVGLAVVSAGVMAIDARSAIAGLALLGAQSSQPGRRPNIVRALAQVGPALLVTSFVLVALPLPGTYDPRAHVDTPTEHVPDLSPLAVAARWSVLDDPLDALEVEVEGSTPGRLRLAVLERFEATGWGQAADFAITGDTLVPDPVFPDGLVADPATSDSLTTVEVRGADGLSGFRAVPTAGVPVSVSEPRGLRYAPDPAIFLPTSGQSVRYTAHPGPLAPPTVASPPVIDAPGHLVECPRSEVLRNVATQLTADTPVAAERLDRIEAWLLTRRIYDPDAPGGQTIGAIERFVSQPFARGNLEVFVSSYALLARCAGVPSRVVVGFPAPAEGVTSYTQGDVAVWVETPLVDVGWVPLDPIPTPEEQQLLAQLAQQPPPSADDDDEVDEPAPVEVEAQSLDESGDRTPLISMLVLLGTAAVVLMVVAVLFALPRLVTRRRRRLADPTAAIIAAWDTTGDALADRGLPLGSANTPAEVAQIVAGHVSPAAQWLIADLGRVADRARYGGVPGTEVEAGQAWARVDAIRERLPRDAKAMAVGLLHPRRTWRRLRTTAGVRRRRKAWSQPLPETVMLSGVEAPADLPEVEIQARIGDGSTGTVYRGTHLPSQTSVAVKVFRFGPGDAGFDQQRFDWEVRVAQGVSGLPHLPTVVGAGITPVSRRPYLLSTLHEEGTLLDRIRRGGPMTTAEAIEIGTDLAAALDALHQLGVIHGDVKPENVFASDDGWILGDLGSAWLRASRGPAATLTPPYAAPEVWRGASPTPTADLYSLALTMLFACTGNVPIAGNPPPLTEIEAAFPDHPVMARALDPNARRRPRAVAEFARALRPDLVTTSIGHTRTLNLPTPTVSHTRNQV